jgi:glycosyltransferase involved in cell wall biosynthesis
MRVLMVCEGLNSSTVIAQPWKHVFEIGKRMKDAGIDVSIISDQTKNHRQEEHVSNISISHIRRKALTFDIDSLAAEINKKEADVINWHCSDTWSAVYFRLLRGKIRSSIVWTLHSGIVDVDDLRPLNWTDYLQLYKYWNNFASSAIPKMVIRKWVADGEIQHIITASERTANKMREICSDGLKVTAIPSGVDTNIFKPSANTDGDFTILYFGPLSTLRGVDVLLAAFKMLRKRVGEARLILLGREHRKRGVNYDKGMPEGVHIVSAVLGVDRLISFLNSATLVALPFRFWPQVECPLTILEAMAMSKTVVTTPVGAIPEMLIDGITGRLVNPRHPAELARVMRYVFDHPLQRVQMGRRAREYVKRFHDWNTITDQTLDVLRSSV